MAKVVCCAQPGLAAKTAGLLALRRALAHGAEKARRVNVHLAPKRAKATLMVLSSHAGHRVGSTSQSFLHFFFGFLHPPSPTDLHASKSVSQPALQTAKRYRTQGLGSNIRTETLH